MTSIGKTPRRQPDGRLSNVVLEGGRSKKYITRDAQGRFVIVRTKGDHHDSEPVTYKHEPQASSGTPNGKII